MSASNPASSPAPSTEKRIYEPSMEEILASIRRIIADDQSLPGRIVSEGEAEPRSDLRRAEPSPVEPSRFGPAPVEPPPVEPRHAEPPLGNSLHAAMPDPQAHQGRTARSSLDVGSDDAVPDADERSHEPAAPETRPAARLSPIQWATPEPEPEVAPNPYSISPYPQHPAAHGSVASPQYAGPDGGLGVEENAFALRRDTTIEPAPQSPQVDEPVEAKAPLPELDVPAPEPFDEPIEPPPPPEPSAAFSPLFSTATDSSVASAFNVLAASRLAANSDDILNIVREMIRPLLRNWLDENLPSMVERMVRDEIERVARGGR